MENYPLKPEVLTPTSAFNDAILKFAKPFGIKGRNLPYSFKSNSVNVKIHYYFERYVVVTVTLMNTIEIGINDVQLCNKLNKYPEIYKLACGICGLILSGNHKKLFST